MRFQVPQFIEVEDRIFGPPTLKQFIYMAGGGGLSFMVYVFLNSLLLSVVPIIIIMGISTALAFYKINNKPFVSVIESAFHYYIGNKLYIWKKQETTKAKRESNPVQDAKSYASDCTEGL
jgi:hypothetical protein